MHCWISDAVRHEERINRRSRFDPDRKLMAPSARVRGVHLAVVCREPAEVLTYLRSRGRYRRFALLRRRRRRRRRRRKTGTRQQRRGDGHVSGVRGSAHWLASDPKEVLGAVSLPAHRHFEPQRRPCPSLSAPTSFSSTVLRPRRRARPQDASQHQRQRCSL